RFLRTKPSTVVKKRQESWLYRNYTKALKWGLKRRALILSITIVLVGISGFTLYKTGTEFLPPTDEGFVSLSVELPNNATVDKTEQIVSEIEEMAKQYEEVDVVVSLIGGNQQSLSRGTSEQNEGEISVKLVELSKRDRSIFEFVEQFEKQVQQEIGERAEVTFSLSSSSGSTPNSLTFRVTDSNELQLKNTVTSIQQNLAKINSVVEVTTDLDEVQEEIQVEVNREDALQYGLMPAQIAQTVNMMTRGAFTTQIIAEDGEVLGVYTGFGKAYREDVEALKTMKLRTNA